MDYYAARSEVDKNLVAEVELFDADNSGSGARAEPYDGAGSRYKRSTGAFTSGCETSRYVPGEICLSASPVVVLSQRLLQSRSPILPQKLDAPSFRRSAIVEIMLGAAFPIPSG